MIGSSTEVAVVGAGITGLSTAYALERRGVDFVCLEAAAPGSGQSAGRTRVFRHGHDDERLVRLAVRARAEWERLEGELGARLLGREGVLVCGPNVAERAAAFEAAGVPARRVGPHEQTGVLPVFHPPDDEALLDALGGSIDVRAAIEGLAAALGDRLVRARVFAVRERGAGVELQTSEGLWSAERAVLCPGAQLHELTAGLGLEIPLTGDLHTRASFPVREPGARLACLLDRSGVHGETVYATPMPDGREYAIGIGGEQEPPVDEALARLTAYVERGMPGLDAAPASVRLCQTSILPWGADAFAVWDTGRVAVLAGANLFKFGPLLGELLAEGTIGELSPEAQLGCGRRDSNPHGLSATST
jgi:glycine/D-amino acid oxidase-like deaminating enzyme